MPLLNFQTVQLATFISPTWNIHTKSLECKIVLWGYNVDMFMSSVEKQSQCYRKRKTFFFQWCKRSHDPVLLVSVYARFLRGKNFMVCVYSSGIWQYSCCSQLENYKWFSHNSNGSRVVLACRVKGHRQVLCDWMQIAQFSEPPLSRITRDNNGYIKGFLRRSNKEIWESTVKYKVWTTNKVY